MPYKCRKSMSNTEFLNGCLITPVAHKIMVVFKRLAAGYLYFSQVDKKCSRKSSAFT